MALKAGWRPHGVTHETPAEIASGPVERYWDGSRWTDKWRAEGEAGDETPIVRGWMAHPVSDETPIGFIAREVERYWDGAQWTVWWRTAGDHGDGILAPQPGLTATRRKRWANVGAVFFVLLLVAGYLAAEVFTGEQVVRPTAEVDDRRSPDNDAPARMLRGNPDGMIMSCARSHGLVSETDMRASSTSQPEGSAIAQVRLRDGAGRDIGSCRVEVTRDTHRVRTY